MFAKHILAVAGAVFVAAALIIGPGRDQGRTLLLVAAIFIAISTWLFLRG